ncbi:MAG: DUF5658 family protein [Methanotrichaceae archaeon]|nr:DUF5658 family protein [Methanotrichaceae archaeon]
MVHRLRVCLVWCVLVVGFNLADLAITLCTVGRGWDESNPIAAPLLTESWFICLKVMAVPALILCLACILSLPLFRIAMRGMLFIVGGPLILNIGTVAYSWALPWHSCSRLAWVAGMLLYSTACVGLAYCLERRT